jgi:predicted PurR-regulated permease PerM
MSREARLVAWLLVLAVFGFLLFALRGVLLPFVAGMAVAYFLDPVADRLEERGISRTLATALITVAFFVLAISFVIVLVPLLQSQVVGFVGKVPDLVEAMRERAGPLLERLQAHLSSADLEDLRSAAQSYAGQAIRWIGGLIKQILGGGVALLNLLSLLLITPLVTFYLLRDWDRITERIDGLLPRKAAPTIRAQAAEIDRIIAGFVRGQATVCLILGTFYGIGLSVVGLEFGLIIGFATGLISFIPYFGMLVGLVVGFGVALAQFSDWMPIAMVAGVFLVGQIVEGNFLTPKLVGDRVGLHPVWVIFALLAGGALFGFTGVLLSVPAAAVIGVLVRFAAERYRDSGLYAGDDG